MMTNDFETADQRHGGKFEGAQNPGGGVLGIFEKRADARPANRSHNLQSRKRLAGE
jgi:hypothetical protein